MINKLNAIVEYLKDENHILSYLKDGLIKDDFLEIVENQYFFKLLPNELFSMYEWHNGMKETDANTFGEIQLFNRGYFFSIEKAIDIYKNNDYKWDKGLFPVFENQDGDFLLYAFNETESFYKKIFIQSATSIEFLEPVIIYDSLDNMFDTIIKCYDKGAYYFKDHRLEIDFDLEFKISKSLNPLAPFWNT